MLVKSSTKSEDWTITDTVRGSGATLKPNSDIKENTNLAYVTLTNTGFSVGQTGLVGDVGETYIYIAIADPTTTTYYDEVNTRAVSQHELVRRFGVDADSTNLRNQGIYPLVNQPTGMTDAFVKEGDAYRAIPNRVDGSIPGHSRKLKQPTNGLDDANEKLLKIQSDFEARLLKLEG